MKHWLIHLISGSPPESVPGDRPDRPDAQFEAEWRPMMKRRVLLVLGLLGVWGTAVEAKLVWLQVVQREFYATEAQKQRERVITVDAGRGDILDRNGITLATSVQAFDVNVDPSLAADPAMEARLICDALGDCSGAELKDIAAKLNKREDKFERIRKAATVSPAAAERLSALKDSPHKLASLLLVAQTQRFYPKRELAAHVLGFVGSDNRGGGGIEFKYNDKIRGRNGSTLVLKDRQQRELATRTEVAPTAGATLELTIDANLQYYAERVLRDAVRATNALGGTIIVMEPSTGELFAFANWPTFNPNSYNESSEEARRNRGVQDTYEPGSTFKIITAAAAIEEGLLSPTDLIDTNPGSIHIGSRVIDEAKGHNYGVLTFEDVLVRSSNVGAIQAGLRVGAERMGRYALRFGIGQKLGPDFSGESAGQFLPFSTLDDSGLASISMGYQIGVTPLQMAAACSVIANGGVLVEPHLVRAIIHNGTREVVPPKALRRVVSLQTTQTLRTIMEGVVTERGTAKAAALDRYQVAGKTGTAAKVINGAYSKTDYNVSFVGFVPSRQPAFTILVVIDTPRGVPAYGGTVAAPVFKALAEAALQYRGVPPSINPVPAIITASGPPSIRRPATPAVVVPTSFRTGDRAVMPDLRGLTLRDALRIANGFSVTMTSVVGDGIVVAQTPAAGEAIEPGRSGSLQLRREPVSLSGGSR